jgi:hypothetical protein
VVRPGLWEPPVACSRLEQEVMKRVKRARLFVWLREHRHELFDQDFQAELAQMYQDKPVGQPPVPPAQLALATILQAYTGASDDEVIEATVMDRRWQLVLGCMDHATAPFSKATLVAFWARLIVANLDRRLVERTVARYGQLTGRVAGGKLRVALDASPLWGAGRVEDTINLLGHALRQVVGVLARQQGWGLAEGTRVLAERAGVPELAGSSLKAALDLDWDDPAALEHALGCWGWRSAGWKGWPPRWPVGATRQWPRGWRRPGRSATRTPWSTRTASGRSARASQRIGGSRSRTPRCATAARPRASGSTATSATCSPTWTPAWSVRSG